ncbi:MAG: HAD hydrolase family protein [Candidatus Odinarchaeum yellowstonii]|uniref:phosphoserine phosphatase n=1 Tax=Odinarchaeota yellowstonii (strain LCB_4) TaxID=1841599 RepID=A0AAF0D295_ODILC|nr:MAG: HAD hydrolase family protein [Candidatus Odinarchaeum yellowstonii]
MKLTIWDLEGPISYVDFAADLFKKLEGRLNRSKLDLFYQMISNYDDYLIENPQVTRSLGVDDYEPGDTLRLLAPFYAYYFTDEELSNISKSNPGLIPGSVELFKRLYSQWLVYVISTSYTQHAYNIASLIDLPLENVYCTDFPVEDLKKTLGDITPAIQVLIDNIFPKYISKGLTSVVEDLNDFFFKKRSKYTETMMKVTVRGGRRKEKAMLEIAEKHGYPLKELIVVGDSITDINMLKRVKDEGGVAVSFNGNQYSVPNANIAVTSPNQMGSHLLFENHDRIWDWLDKWVEEYPNFKDNPKKIPAYLISESTKKYFIQHNFIPRIDDLRGANSSLILEVVKAQKEMRRKVRGWVGVLG